MPNNLEAYLNEPLNNNSRNSNVVESNKDTIVCNNNNFMPILIESSCRNNNHIKIHGRRYDESTKLFATYLFMVERQMLYEILEANLPLPSLSIVSRTRSRIGDCVVEGKFRTKELNELFLDQRTFGATNSSRVEEGGNNYNHLSIIDYTWTSSRSRNF